MGNHTGMRSEQGFNPRDIMTRHVMAITYEQKIEPVRCGDCRQTIRTIGKRKISIGDIITFHGWTGRPYRSKWSWRKEVTVTKIIKILISIDGMVDMDDISTIHKWDSYAVNLIADNDYIVPATGAALKDVLFKLNGVPKEPVECMIIRW